MLRTKKAGLLTKIVVFILLAYGIFSLLNLNRQITLAKDEYASLSQQTEAQRQRNAELSDAIENSSDPEHRKDIAREKLGLLEPGEKVFEITD